MPTQSLSSIKPNPKNPRKITDQKLQMLRASLARFGDLSGIVVNRTSGHQLVGGHQRLKAFAELGAQNAIIERTYDRPTSAGTVAAGYIQIDGERYSYREVVWDSDAEAIAANLAANAQAGDWDLPEVADMLRELRDFDIDLDLTMFNAAERETMFGASSFEPSEDEPARLDEKKMTMCPSCGHEF
ncbi:MAG: hypothetical protein EOO38_00295 [Cytophagaceae bacterium]|nr:MAG: hypothetical protein EOO38_00295 [Cytophagaceae bacterium]